MSKIVHNLNLTLLLGDWLALAIVTAVGFFNHNSQFLPGRYLATALPLMLGWLITSPWLGLLKNQNELPLSQAWWRIAWAVLLSTPLGLLIRSLILASSVQFSFALVMVITSFAAIILWRLIYGKLVKRP